MFEYIQSILMIMLEAFCCKIFFDTFGEKRFKKSIWQDRGMFLGLMLLFCFVAFVLRDQFLLRQILAIAEITIFMLVYLKINLTQSIILAALYQGLLLALDYLAYLLNIFLFQSLLQMEETYYVQSSLVYALGKCILFMMVLIIRKCMEKGAAAMSNGREWLRFIFFPVFTIGTIKAMLIASGGVKNSELERVHFIIALGLMGLNIVVFYLIRDILRREREIHERSLSELQAKNQSSLYRSIAENYDKQRKRIHEYQNRILCIEALLSKKNYSELVEYVAEISGRLGKELNYFQTNHAIVDAVLNTKYQEAMDKNIVFVVKVNDLSNIKLRNDDIVIILSNLLNNAIEACDRCHGKKVIKLKFIKGDGTVAITVTNTYEHELVYHEGYIRTSKNKRVEEHGFGIRNVEETVRKYGGSHAIKTNGHEFNFFIKLPELYGKDPQIKNEYSN